ncbi:DegT/DnrJ/EryC1/StrS family aminotransferase [Haloarcula regularis]|nr:DegT/DnrJ/EryC1/StrS family aminotransferase [Halomicroarcula sp. SYNS111]
MIPVAKPDMGDQEFAQIKEALDTGWIGLGPKVDKFESKFSGQFGYGHVIATNSGTSALDLSIKASDLSGSEILVPPLTWVSTAFVCWYNNYEIGWVDVEPETLNMSPDALQKRITDDTAAVIPVHYGGQPAEIESIVEIAHDHDAVVIEDCAHAVGTTFQDKSIGTIGDIGCFSFQATKPLTTGEGGALVTDDDDIASQAKL